MRKSKEKTVLIIAPEDDIHARSVADLIESEYGEKAVIWDSKRIPSQDKINLELINGNQMLSICRRNNCIDVGTLNSIWWRRPMGHHVPNEVTDRRVDAFCKRETDRCFRGGLFAIDAPIINPPIAEEGADYKPLQLSTADHVGLSIPKTLASNDPEEIRSFYHKISGDCIYKVFTAPPWTMAETRLLNENNLNDLESLQYAPIIVQERIDKIRDVRVTVVGPDVFAASVKTNIKDAEIDWRLDLSAEWNIHQLPSSLENKLKKLIKELGLEYGCIDLCQKKDGEYIFLENNPSGQFLFMEIDTGQQISKSFAQLLLS